MRGWMEVALDLIAKTRKPDSPDRIAMGESWSKMQEDAQLGAAIGFESPHVYMCFGNVD